MPKVPTLFSQIRPSLIWHAWYFQSLRRTRTRLCAFETSPFRPKYLQPDRCMWYSIVLTSAMLGTRIWSRGTIA